MIYFCAQKNRRDLVLRNATLNGIDYLEVITDHPGCGRQLAVTFLKDARSLKLSSDNVRVSGNTSLQVTGIEAATDDEPLLVTITLDATGNFSPYVFSLVDFADGVDPPAGIDPALSSMRFSFKAGCPSPVDCKTTQCCPAPHVTPPDINYLAKDYAGFVQVMRDRLAVLAPGWTEAHAADLGVAIIEALAYAGDHLSYQQDAVSTEAYIGTARSRFGLSPAKLGLIYSPEDSRRLANTVGLARAREMLLTGRLLDAPTALQWVLLNRLVADDELAAVVATMVAELRQTSATARAGIKQVLAYLGGDDRVDHAAATAVFNDAFGSADFAEGASAFLAKRPPHFQ